MQMLDGVGGPAGLVGWIEDAAIAVLGRRTPRTRTSA